MGSSSQKSTSESTSKPLKSATEVASEFSASLPQVLQAVQQYQPQFSQAAFDEFSAMLPQYKSLYASISPESAGLQEMLAGQAKTMATQGLTQEEMDFYKNQFKSMVGNASSPIGASAVAKNLLGQNIAQKQYGQNLGLQLSGMYNSGQMLPTPSSFSVASAFSPMFSANIYGQTGTSSQTTTSTPSVMQNIASGLGAAGGLMAGIGSMGTSTALTGLLSKGMSPQTMNLGGTLTSNFITA